MFTGLIIAVLAAMTVTACGVTRGEESVGLHRLRMMVPNSPGGGYDLTARTAVKIMEDTDITGRVEVFNVIGAGGTVAMARLMNEKGSDDLMMMMMGLSVVGATYTNGSDVDPDAPSDWRTVGLLVGLFVATILLVQPLGWAITGTLLFAGAAALPFPVGSSWICPSRTEPGASLRSRAIG